MNMFVRVVETGSFSAVARELNSTQPTVSKNIAELESWLGAKLLNRNTRSLRLTEAGSDYYEKCVGILQDIEEAEQNVGQIQTQPRGTVRINTVVAFGRLHIIPRLAEFFSLYPEISIDLRLNDRVVDLVEEGIDLAFRMGRLADSSLVAKRLCSSPWRMVATPDYIKQKGCPTHPSDLKEHNFIVYSDSGTGRQLDFQEGDAILKVHVDGNVHTNNTEALRAAVLSGLGISRMPCWAVGDALAEGRLVSILDQYQPEPLNIYAIYPPGRHLPSKVRCLMEFFSSHFQNCEAICGC